MNIYFFKSLNHIFTIILIISQVYAYDHWTNVTDETFNWETSYDKVKWLLFFSKKDCAKCNEVYNLLNKVMKKFPDQKVGFVLIDSIKCPWLVNRFNVTYLPKIILLESDLMYIYHSTFNEKNIINFVNKKKPVGSALPKPTGAKIKYIYKAYGSLLSHKINTSMQFILDKLHIPLKWNKYYTIFFFIIFFIIFVYLSVFTLLLFCKVTKAICCCSLCRRKKPKKNIENLKEKLD